MSDDNKERLAQWMIRNSLATGHGDTFEDLLTELEWQVNELKLQARQINKSYGNISGLTVPTDN